MGKGIGYGGLPIPGTGSPLEVFGNTSVVWNYE